MSRDSGVYEGMPIEGWCHQGAPKNQSVLATITLGTVYELPITDIMQLMEDQPESRGFYKLIRSLVNSDINHRLWQESAKVYFSVSIALHPFATPESLR